MERTSHAARYVTLRDYLRVLRRYRVAIVLIAVIGGTAGYFAAKRQKPVYEAKTSVSFQDPTQDLSIVGFGTNSVQSPAQLASENAETITRPQVIAAVKRNLRTSLPIASLSAAVSGQVSLASGLLAISARSSNPAFASQLANGVAQVIVNQDNRQTQTRFAAVARNLRKQIATLGSTSKAASNQELLFYADELARVDTLSRFAHSAQVQQFAGQPTSPVSPKTARSALIGLILGLLLAIALAFFRDSMDRRLRTPHDMESYFRLPVLGHVRDHVMGRIAQEGNGASEDYQVDLEAFRILRRNLEFLNFDCPPRSIVVTSAVPEEGKTTVAGSLAFAMASAGRRTLLVDCDLRRPALGPRLGIEQSPGMSDFLAGDATPEQILRTIDFGEPPSSNGASANGTSPGTSHTLVFIPAGSPTSHSAELLGSNRFKEFLKQVSEAYDMVVIDSAPLLPVADTLEMLPSVEGIVLCARAQQTTRDEALAMKTALSRFPERPTGMVVTGIKPHRDDYEVYAYSYGYS